MRKVQSGCCSFPRKPYPLSEIEAKDVEELDPSWERIVKSFRNVDEFL
jgi:hypothetical protein